MLEMFVCLFVCLLACLFVCLFVCLLACLLVCLFVCLFVCLLACVEHLNQLFAIYTATHHGVPRRTTMVFYTKLDWYLRAQMIDVLKYELLQHLNPRSSQYVMFINWASLHLYEI